MGWKVLWIVLAIGFDQAVSHWFFSAWSGFDWYVQSQLVLILLIYWQLHDRSDKMIVFGLIVGWIYDSASDQLLLGVHALSYGLILLVLRWHGFSWMPADPIRWFIVCELGMVVNEFILYAIHWMFKQTEIAFSWAFIHQTMPIAIVHLIGITLFIGIQYLYRLLRNNQRFGLKS